MAGLQPPTPLAPATFPNISNGAWYNLTAWSINVNRYVPVFEDLVWAGPRLVKRLGSLINLSDTLETAGQHIVITPTDPGVILDTGSTIRNIMEPAVAVGGRMDAVGGGSDTTIPSPRVSLDGARGLGSVFGYATSKWALSCFLMAFILNRTLIFAATRRRPRLRWPTRFLLRILPIILLVLQARRLLQAIQCQTSTDFSELRWGNASKSSDLMFSHPNRVLNSLSSTLLFGATDEQSCVSVKMVPAPDSDSARGLSGSLSLLWPLFGTFCLSQFLETVSCAVQGRVVAMETVMNLFEQSLAFAEADAAIGNQLGWSIFTKAQPATASASNIGSTIALSQSLILKRVNTPPEVLLIAFLSAMTHITSHVLGVFNLQARYRLINTGFWGICYIGSMVWSALQFDIEDPSSQGLLRFPTVCIVGIMPHVTVLVGIIVCFIIYGLSVLLSVLSPNEAQEAASMSFRQRIVQAHQNMQANVSLSGTRIAREMDFYTALLRIGFSAMTMASEAVYLNEDRGVNVKRYTWLEEERFREIEEMQRKWAGAGLPDSQFDQVGTIGLIPVKTDPSIASNGYARERAAQNLPNGRGERGIRMGLGASERGSRWLMSVEFIISINKLLLRVFAKIILWCLHTLRIRHRPSWLLWLARHPKSAKDDKASSSDGQGHDQASESVPRKNGLDIEAEFRRASKDQDEAGLDKDLYSYWMKGGWWGSEDSSGDFEPLPDDDNWDTTSVVSMSTNASDGAEDGWGTEDEDGQRTPTQRSPLRSGEQAPFADNPMDLADLARLLHPSSPEEREEARTLGAHLQSDGVMTRSRFRRMEQLQRTRILTAPGSGVLQRAGVSVPANRNVKLSPDEEERLLEQLILSCRQARLTESGEPKSWTQGGSGFGSDGPQCVVCQSSPRTIIVWPCRCLSLCDDCRVSLAMNNFDKCVCCRREVISFSRIFVP